MSISAISGAKGAKDLPDSYFSALYFKNDKSSEPSSSTTGEGRHMFPRSFFKEI